jgi:16S rRNA (guanine527-N7)-methyltransferase
VEHDSTQLLEFLQATASELSISIPASALVLFGRYLTELKQWNRAINLTSMDNEREIVVKHFVDSLAGLKIIEITRETKLIDIGAGAGFPAFPIKFVRPDLFVELLEPSEKRGAFLRYMVGSLGLLRTTIATAKLEDYVNRKGTPPLYDYIVVRAFKVDHMGFALRSLLNDGGKVVLYRATKVEDDFKLDGLALIREVEYELPAGYGHRTLSVFSKQAG